jgi:hypothetical protein
VSELRSYAFRRVGGVLKPSSMATCRFMDGLKDGREVLVSVRTPRNILHHRKLFALLERTIENSDRWANKEVLLEDLKLATGLFTTRVSALSGMPYPVPASISFAAMDQKTFGEWYEKAVAVLAEHLGVDPETLLAEVEREAA